MWKTFIFVCGEFTQYNTHQILLGSAGFRLRYDKKFWCVLSVHSVHRGPTSVRIGDRLDVGSKHFTHMLKIHFGYARHYLDIFLLRNNLQVAFVNVCEHSHNLSIQLMPSVFVTY